MKQPTCQVFTPEQLVQEMLNKLGYTTQLYGKKILENSCGDGAFLKEIVRRYIADARSANIPDDRIRNGLAADICGIEKDESCHAVCLEILNQTAASFGITEVDWNVRQADALSEVVRDYYDYVVGNPPYMTYYNLNQQQRDQIRERFETCQKGKADYYYAFTEAAICSLRPGGRLAYLIPNNFMKNRFSEELRKYLLPHIIELTDYRNQKIFKNHQTSSAILLCQKNSHTPTFQYVDIPAENSFPVVKQNLQGKWAFYLRPVNRSVKFGDWFQVSAPVATLLNEAFVLDDIVDESDIYVVTERCCIERSILRKAASPRTLQKQQAAYIIFPYRYVNGNRQSFDECDFRASYPLAYAYLERFKDRLKKRKKDAKCQWFEYGRSQALMHIDQEKIILSTLMTGIIRYYRQDADTVPFSGMYIVPKAGHTLEEAEAILSSADFLKYILEIGISVNGLSYRISPMDVRDYKFQQPSVRR